MTQIPPSRDNIQDILLEKEMQESYLNYSMSVIYSRALPDVRDGLKPSQRRVLVAMDDLNLGPRSKFRKCAKICGDTSGNYHPHGESVVYPTLVGMDAPLFLPAGRCCLRNDCTCPKDIHFRQCDLDLRRRHIKFFPITLGPASSSVGRRRNRRSGARSSSTPATRRRTTTCRWRSR